MSRLVRVALTGYPQLPATRPVATDRHLKTPLQDRFYRPRIDPVILPKRPFWRRWAGTPLNERQVKMLNRLLDGFEGKLTSSKWGAIAKCSPDTC
jgi:hypothetical protein